MSANTSKEVCESETLKNECQDTDKAMGAQTQTSGDVNFERLMASMKTTLACIGSDLVQACSIFRVPSTLKNSNEEAYRPKVVSIGPLHWGTRNDLLYKEEIKWRCLLSHFERTSDENSDVNEKSKVNDELRKCLFQGIIKLDQVVRASYVGDIKFDPYDLAKIMVLDGCFLLELLMCCAFPEESEEIDSPGMGVLKNEEILSDVTLLENQIPFFILHKLFEILFPRGYFHEREYQFAEFAPKSALSLLGYGPGSSFISNSPPAHVLELVHSFVTGKSEKAEDVPQTKNSRDTGESEIVEGSRKLPENAWCIDVERESIQKPKKQSHSQLKRCAKRLIAAGVTITAHPEGSHANTKFRGNQLEISPLIVTELTEARWRNMIAWEYNTAIAPQKAKDPIKCKFISDAFLFNGLVCCAHDIEELEAKGIIVNESKKSSQDLMTLFRTITEGVDHLILDSNFKEMCNALNTFPTSDWGAKVHILGWHYWRRFVEWLVIICKCSYHLLIYDYSIIYKDGHKFLKRDYNFVATVLSVLTVVQTVYAVLSYHYSKN